jgi:hypothetical protein
VQDNKDNSYENITYSGFFLHKFDFFALSDLLLIFAHLENSGCSSARLEYLSGGQGAPGSNPGIPTEQKSPPAAWQVAFCFIM